MQVHTPNPKGDGNCKRNEVANVKYRDIGLDSGDAINNLAVFVCFVDYEKAFDRVNWVNLLDALKSIGVDWRDRRFIERLYMAQRARFRVRDGLTNPAVIGRGTRQGYLLSPVLFNKYGEAMLRDALRNVNEGIRMGGHLIKAVRYAHDQTTLTSSVKGLQHMLDKMQETTVEYGMKIN